MEKRPLDITILSAKGLKDIGAFSKMDVYVEVSLSSDPRSVQKTPVDTDGGSSPKWNHGPMRFTLDEPAVQMDRITLVFKLKHERKLMGDKDVGEVNIQVKDLLDKAYDGKADGPIEYEVRKPNSNKGQGSIKFSYKFGEVHKIENVVPPPQQTRDPYPQHALGYSGPPPAGYPAYGASGSYAPPPAYAAPYAPPPGGYPQAPPVAGGYGYGGYQQPPYPQQGYPGGYAQPGYPGGYQQPYQKPQKSGGLGTGAAVGLGAAGGLVGGLLIADMIDDSNDDAYEAGYDAGFDDGGDF